MKKPERTELGSRLLTLLVAVPLSLGVLPSPSMSAGSPSQPDSRTFPETGKTVGGRFLQYWNTHGALPQQGYPISNEMHEISDTDGKSYLVQYFERAVFEYHPENQPPYDVLLSLLGFFYYSQKYPEGAVSQVENTSVGSKPFAETGHRVGGVFLSYWQNNGGLEQQGYPISGEFNEISALDGKSYKVQYFQRAVFEYHPENQPPYDVLLSQLGTFRYRQRYLGTSSSPTPSPLPTSVAATATTTHTPRETETRPTPTFTEPRPSPTLSPPSPTRQPSPTHTPRPVPTAPPPVPTP